MARFVGPCLLVLLLACTRKNPGFDEPTATSSSTSATSAASTGEPTTTGSGATIDPVTQGSSDTGGTVGLTDSGTTEALASTGPDPTTGTADTSTTSDSESSSTGEPGPPPPEHLQLYNKDRCLQPLWCHAPGDVNNGSPARTSSQACFTPKMPPPYRVVRVGYRIVARFGDLSGDSKMQIFERTDQGPGALVKELAIGDPDLGTGPHAVLFDGIEINSPGFCVGLVGGRPMPGAGLGVAVDTEVLEPEQSYIRAEGSVACAIPQWKDVDSFDPPAMPGAWCLDADVEAVP